MSDCTEVRALLLEAEPEALAGQGDDPVAAHVRACPGCAARARVILEETASLDRILARAGSGPDLDTILEAAGVTPSPSQAPVAEAIPAPTQRPAQPPTNVQAFLSWKGWSTLAAAAAVAGLLLVRGESPLPDSAGPVMPETPPLVEAAPNQNVAVMNTANPDITVLWFYK